MKERDVKAADRFGILGRLQELESDLLCIRGITEVEFDVDNYDETQQVILLMRYEIPPSVEDYYSIRRKQVEEILYTCLKHDLFPSGDQIEDYGEHWYIVRKAGQAWPKPCLLWQN